MNPTPQSTNDQALIQGTLAAEYQFLDDGFMDAGATTNLAPTFRGARAAAGVSGTTEAALDPFFFWRQIEHRTLAFQIAFADSDSTGLPRTAFVTVKRDFSGWFNIVPRDASHPDLPDTAHVTHKPLIDHWVRNFLMKRVDLPGMQRPMWKIASASAIEVTAENATTLVTSVRVRTASLDTTLTDPSALIPLRRVLRFSPEDTVTVTVATPRTDDVVLLYHHDRRERLTNNGDGTYSGRFRAGLFSGWRHFAVNALSHGTLYDDAAAYDSKAWIYPYVIVGGPSVDYLP
ncbi:MAG TPA: hypothetical protein VFS09_07475 [Candidatus Eisenbacteria bacterium]|nr:hypothetical protein [Candidatus Eisenbacteria bacterium]